MAIPLDPRFIGAFSIETVLLDKDTGAPLSGGLVYFEKDNQRGIPKPVYQITGTSPDYTFAELPNPVTLSSIGTFEDAMDNPIIPYFFPYDSSGDIELYYIRVTNSAGVEQFTREAQPYLLSQGSSSITSLIGNEISNPQFIEVLFGTSLGAHTFDVSSLTDNVISIAPDWDLITTAAGTGSVTATQVTPAGSDNIITNPGTILKISSSGLSKLQLRQRIFGSPNLWGSGNLSASFIAKTFSGTTPMISMYYSQSSGVVVDALMVTATLASSGAYGAFSGTAAIPASTNAQTFPNAYIDIYFDLPLSIEIAMSSVMVAFTGDSVISNISYDQETEARQIDHLFHYYNDKLQYKPIPSYTIGWDFPFNPGQALGPTIVALDLGAINKSRYIADQTIAFEPVRGVLSYALSTPNGLTIATTGTTQFAIIQYLDQRTARELLSQRMSVCLNGKTSASTINGTVSLYYTTDATLPSVAPATYNSLVLSMASGKAASFTGTWTEVERSDLGNTSFTLTTTSTSFQLSGFDATSQANITTATHFAIVIGFNAMPSTQTVSLKFCTLNAGDIASPPPALSYAETLSALEAYYETSYPDVVPGTVTPLCQEVTPMSYLFAAFPGNTSMYTLPFGHTYRTPKRKASNFNLYSPDTGVINTVRGNIYTSAVSRNSFDISSTTYWTLTGASKGFYCLPLNVDLLGTTASVTNTNPNTTITYQFIADCRFGIVL